VIVLATSAGLTVTPAVFEVTVVEALSVTWSSNDQAPKVKGPVEMLGKSPALQENAVPRLP